MMSPGRCSRRVEDVRIEEGVERCGVLAVGTIVKKLKTEDR